MSALPRPAAAAGFVSGSSPPISRHTVPPEAWQQLPCWLKKKSQAGWLNMAEPSAPMLQNRPESVNEKPPG